jgi:hypothetical protein
MLCIYGVSYGTVANGIRMAGTLMLDALLVHPPVSR